MGAFPKQKNAQLAEKSLAPKFICYENIEILSLKPSTLPFSVAVILPIFSSFFFWRLHFQLHFAIIFDSAFTFILSLALFSFFFDSLVCSCVLAAFSVQYIERERARHKFYIKFILSMWLVVCVRCVQHRTCIQARVLRSCALPWEKTDRAF